MKKINHIILAFTYIPGSAHVNRILGYKKGYEACGVKVILVAFCLNRFGCPEFMCESDICCCEPNIPLRITRRLIARYKMRKTVECLYNSDDTVVHIYGVPTWAQRLPFSNMDVFFEQTEIPFYAASKSLIYKYEQSVVQKLSMKGRGLLCITSGLKSYFTKLGVKNVEVINMFVDKSRFENISANETEDKYIFYCGNIGRHKDGVDILIGAFRILHDKYPDYKLKLAGGFDHYYNEEEFFLQLVKDLNLEDSVEFMGRVQSSLMPQMMMDASILALARPQSKQATYGFPTKVGEYLCTGRPVVLTNVGEITNYLKDGKNCLVSEPNNIGMLASKMIWVVENYDKAKAISKEGSKLVDNEFSSNAQSQKAIDFFYRIIKN